jgi:signal transduction histidine kinase
MSHGDEGLARVLDPLAGLERVAFAEEVAAVLRHELRNKLSSVRNAAYYLSQRAAQAGIGASDPRFTAFLQLIDEQVAGCDQLLCDKASFADVYPRRVGRVRLGACAERAAALSRAASPVSITVEDEGEVEADPDELALAIRCLIENAAEASEAGGRVDVAVRREGERRVVEVRDQGPGIAEASWERLLEPLHTTKQGRLGLGLNVADRVAHRYGGALGLRPAERGACVTLALPAAGA